MLKKIGIITGIIIIIVLWASWGQFSIGNDTKNVNKAGLNKCEFYDIKFDLPKTYGNASFEQIEDSIVDGDNIFSDEPLSSASYEEETTQSFISVTGHLIMKHRRALILYYYYPIDDKFYDDKVQALIDSYYDDLWDQEEHEYEKTTVDGFDAGFTKEERQDKFYKCNLFLVAYNQGYVFSYYTENDKPSEELSEIANSIIVSEKLHEAAEELEKEVSNAVPWNDASSHIGEEITIKGKVEEINYTNVSGKPIFIDIGEEYPNKDRVTAVIWEENRDKFDDLDDYYLADVLITGTPYWYDGVVNIELTDPSQIKNND